MRRREFIAGLGGAAAWPLAGRAQQAAMPVVGYLAGSLGLGENAKSFSEALAQAGYVEGRNLTIDFRTTNGQYVDLAADLVRRGVTLIFASGIGAARAAKAQTASVPILFVFGVAAICVSLVSASEFGLSGLISKANAVICGMISFNSSKRLPNS